MAGHFRHARLMNHFHSGTYSLTALKGLRWPTTIRYDRKIILIRKVYSMRTIFSSLLQRPCKIAWFNFFPKDDNSMSKFYVSNT